MATPRLISKVSEDYEPPQKKEVVEQERVHPPLTEQAKEEIRKQVREELRLQQEANGSVTTTPAPTPKSTQLPQTVRVRPAPPRQPAPSVVNPDSNI